MTLRLPDFDTAITDYYKLKEKYQDQINKKIGSLRDNVNLTKKERKTLFADFKEKCIFCKKEGGTIFEDKNNILSAICGSSSKCKLDIQIQRSKYTNINNDIQLLNKYIINNKTNIIKNKLDVLFGYHSEQSAIQDFKVLKEELVKDLKKFQQLYNSYIEVVTQKSIVANQESLLIAITEFKDLIKNYMIEGDKIYLTDAIQLYLNSIEVMANDIRNIKYHYNAISLDENEQTRHLIQELYTITELQIPVNNADNRVISFIT